MQLKISIALVSLWCVGSYVEAGVVDDKKVELQAYVKVQNELNIQNADTAYGLRQALSMAELLISLDGHLNPAMRKAVAAQFISKTPLEYEKNMKEILDQLDASWIPFFDQVTAPEESNLVGQLAVRALFGCKKDVPLTDRQARVAVLSALLAPYNQGPVGNCFSVAGVLRNHEEYFRHAATDYAALIMKGYLEREVKDEKEYFFFLPTIGDADRMHSFSLTQKGMVSSKYALFDVPGLAAARALMGECFAGQVADVLFDGRATTVISVSVDDVIEAMATLISSTTGEDQQELMMRGQYGFSSLTNHPVLRGIETAFASMAEDSADDLTRSDVNGCIQTALRPFWNSAFGHAFDRSYRLVYNADIPMAFPSADGSSTQGGFQMYRKVEPATDIGIPVVTPQDLRDLVLRVIDALPPGAIGEGARAQAETDAFLKNVLWAYDSQNRSEADPIRNYQRLSRTPMQSPDGDNPFAVNEVDDISGIDDPLTYYRPSNTKDLLSWCLGLAKTTTLDFIPMTSPQHAFNFVPTYADIASFTTSKLTTPQWIQKVLIRPGMQMASSPITAAECKQISSGMWQIIGHYWPDPKTYQQLSTNTAQTAKTVQAYTQKLFAGIKRQFNLNADQTQLIGNLFDQVVLTSLSASHLSALSQSAVRFALTNWNDGLKNIYFCAYFNPRTGQIAFGSILEDRTHLQPMNETEWVNNQYWHVDMTPPVPLYNISKEG